MRCQPCVFADFDNRFREYGLVMSGVIPPSMETDADKHIVFLTHIQYNLF